MRGAAQSFLPGPPAAVGHAAMCQGGGRRCVARALSRCSSPRSLSVEGPCAFTSIAPAVLRLEVRAAGTLWWWPLLRPWLRLPVLRCQPGAVSKSCEKSKSFGVSHAVVLAYGSGCCAQRLVRLTGRREVGAQRGPDGQSLKTV